VGDALDIMKYFVCLMLKINLAYKLKPQGEVAQNQRFKFIPTTLKFDDNVAKGERHLWWASTFLFDAHFIYIGQ